MLLNETGYCSGFYGMYITNVTVDTPTGNQGLVNFVSFFNINKGLVVLKLAGIVTQTHVMSKSLSTKLKFHNQSTLIVY